MITVRPGSHAHDIITLLSFVGEFPVRSLHLLGNERVIKALVHRMTLLQEYRLPDDAQPRLTCKLLKISGERSYKTLRLTKAAIPYWTGFIRMRESIIWALSGIIDSPETHPSGAQSQSCGSGSDVLYGKYSTPGL